jgi:hypothetical protein
MSDARPAPPLILYIDDDPGLGRLVQRSERGAITSNWP